jgi:hypothetical protein
LATRGVNSIFGGHAMAHLLVDGLAQEAFELLVNLIVACALVAECADAVLCAAQKSHRYALRMRLMAAIWRPQFSVSLLRALRPFQSGHNSERAGCSRSLATHPSRGQSVPCDSARASATPIYAKGAVADLLDPQRDTIVMHRRQSQRLQDQHLQCSLNQVRMLVGRKKTSSPPDDLEVTVSPLDCQEERTKRY